MKPSSMSRAVGSAAVIIMLGNLTSSLLGYVRLAVIGKVFGETIRVDAFTAALYIPQMFYDLTIGGAVSAALIPTFTEVLERRGQEELARTAGRVLALAWLALTLVVAALLLVSQPLMNAILVGYHSPARHGGLELAVEMARILVPTLLFLGTSAVILSTLYSLRRFAAPAFATGLYHLGVIGGALALARPLGVVGLAVGALAGSAMQALSQIPALLRAGVRLRPRLEVTAEIRQIVRLYAPVAAGLIVSIIGQLIDLGFKSGLHSPAILAMQQATTLVQFPIGIAVAAMSFAVLPSISADAALGRMEQFKDTLALGIRLVLFLTIPAAVGYIALSTPIVSLLFQHGRYSAAATDRAAAALAGYAVQIPFVGLDQLLIFAFYARKNTVTPMLVGVLGVGIYIGSALVLRSHYQVLGLALANTIQNSLHGLILLALLFASIGTLHGRGVGQGVAKAVIAAVVMGSAAVGIGTVMERLFPGHQLPVQILNAGVPVVVGTALYLTVAAALRSEELNIALDLARSRLAPMLSGKREGPGPSGAPA